MARTPRRKARYVRGFAPYSGASMHVDTDAPRPEKVTTTARTPEPEPCDVCKAGEQRFQAVDAVRIQAVETFGDFLVYWTHQAPDGTRWGTTQQLHNK